MERSDLGVIPYRNTIDFQNSLSNKTIEYLAGGVALTSGLDGKVRQLIRDNDCGYVYSDQSSSAYRNLLLEILADRQTLERRKKARERSIRSGFGPNRFMVISGTICSKSRRPTAKFEPPLVRSSVTEVHYIISKRSEL